MKTSQVICVWGDGNSFGSRQNLFSSSHRKVKLLKGEIGGKQRNKMNEILASV